MPASEVEPTTPARTVTGGLSGASADRPPGALAAVVPAAVDAGAAAATGAASGAAGWSPVRAVGPQAATSSHARLKAKGRTTRRQWCAGVMGGLLSELVFRHRSIARRWLPPTSSNPSVTEHQV